MTRRSRDGQAPPSLDLHRSNSPMQRSTESDRSSRDAAGDLIRGNAAMGVDLGRCAYGRVGETLWVREPYAVIWNGDRYEQWENLALFAVLFTAGVLLGFAFGGLVLMLLNWLNR
mgnify:CR=1 FL=1